VKILILAALLFASCSKPMSIYIHPVELVQSEFGAYYLKWVVDGKAYGDFFANEREVERFKEYLKLIGDVK